MRYTNHTSEVFSNHQDLCRAPKQGSGFALVATVSMMVLLTLIALGMLSLATLEQRSSGGSAAEADQQARANARMALMIALGELQKAAGPDQRVTATASILGNSKNTGWTGNGTTKEYIKDYPAANGRKHWVGVWDARYDLNEDGIVDDGDKVDTDGDGTADTILPYNPAYPDNKPFLRWLVSSPDSTTIGSLAEVGATAAAASTDDVVIFEGVKLVDGEWVPDPDGPDSVKVPKVEVATTSGDKSYYAYWVEDEGVKTDLAWNEVPEPDASATSDDEERAQARRLSAIAAPNYWLTHGVGGLGPFMDPNDDDDNADRITEVQNPGTVFSFDDMAKAMSLEDLSLVAGGSAAHRNWLKGARHTMSLNNRGVLADVKEGGLRRDLSLAFEMDGDADVSATQQPTLFNQQEGEFVGGTDRLAAPSAALGMAGVKERFLYRDYHGSGTPFSDDIVDVILDRDGNPDPKYASGSIVRGPNWWAVRDYYNLYKRLYKDTSDNYTLDARAYYPNASAGDISHHYGSLHGVHNARTWDIEKYVNRWGTTRSIYKPASASYAPILLGQTVLFSLLATNSDGVEADLALGIDPFFFLWNPYNRKLEVNNYAMVLTTFPGTITFEVENASTVPPTTTRYGPATISKYFRQHVMITEGGQTHFTTQSYMVDGLTMDPGEVIVLSPKSGRDPNRANEFHDELFPGTNTDNASGAILSSIPLITVVPDDPATLDVDESYESTTWGKVRLNLANDTVRYLYCTKYWDPNSAGEYRETNMAEHNWTHTSMPSSGTLPKNAWQDGSRGEHLQQLGGNGAGDRNQPFKEYFVPTSWGANDGTLPPWTGSAAASTLVDTKTWFGINANLLKPAAHERTLYANPVEMFTQFNPARMAGYSDMHRPCLPNECYTLVSGPGDTEGLLQAAGIAWPASELENGFFGQNYTGSGPSPTTHIAMSNIPSSPLISLAAFNHANFGVGYWHPFHSVGNSWASVHVSPTSPYGPRPAPGHTGTATAHDANWMLNDALFDRYFFSGIVPEYTIGSGGYNATGSLSETLRRFYGIDPDAPTQTVDPDTAQASPVLQAYVPAGKTSEGVVDELLETSLDDTANETPGYKKMAAYSMLKGGFNINCTDANAWGRFLRGSNGDLIVKCSDGTTDPRTDGWFGFPSSPSPSLPTRVVSKYQTWSGWSRLRGGSATGDLWAAKGLATNLPPQIMERAPFMSVSNFVNHKVGGTSVTDHHKNGAIQAAADKMNVNFGLRSQNVNYPAGLTADYSNTTYFADDAASLPNRNSTNGIPGAVTQANILLPLTPRLTARSDTFRIRGYGEVTDADGNIIAKATCEAVVQRLPEYVDTETDPANNEPWDEGDILNATNKLYGRRFEIRSFRWLDESEI